MTPRKFLLLMVGVAALGVGIIFWVERGDGLDTPAWNPVRIGPSSPAETVVVLATLDDPLADGRNAAWCASFQLAWDRLKSDVAKGPVQIRGAEKATARLNGGAFDPRGIDDRDVYAAAGWVKDGIVDRIRRDMRARFPEQEADPWPDAPPDGAIAYAFLKAGIKFGVPYFESRTPMMFTDAGGRTTPVASFGIRREDDYAYPAMRRQVQPLYALIDKDHNMAEFAVDLDHESSPYQVIVARVPLKGTLGETLRDLDAKCKQGDERGHFGPNDVLLVPTIHLDLVHRFAELEGPDKPLTNPGMEAMYLDRAVQRIVFRLDRSGAEVASEAKQHVNPIPQLFICDGPFLVLLKKRGATQPLLVLRIADAALLQRWK